MGRNLARHFKHYELDTDFWWWYCRDCGEWFHSRDLVVVVSENGKESRFCPECGSRKVGLEG